MDFKTMKQLIFFILIITSLSLNAQGVKIQPKNCTTPTVDTDIKLLFSVVNDSIRIDSFDNKLGVIVGSPQFIDDAINKPDLLQGAANDLRVSGTTIVEGTDDPNNAKGSQLIYNTTSVMDGFYRQYLGTEGVVFNIDAIRNSSNRIVTIDFGDLLVNNIRVGRGIGNVATNTAVGNSVLNSNSTGFFNTGGGYTSLYSNTTGFFNTAYGALSLYNNTTGVFNTFSGYSSGENANGDYSCGFGANALKSNIGAYNTGLGFNVLQSNTTGYQNTAVGSGALTGNLDGFRNNAFGHYALNSNLSGYINCAIGYYSMSESISPIENTAVGNYSLRNANGAYNVGIGVLAGEFNNGSTNVFIGHGSGKNSLASNGSVFIGYGSGQNELSDNKLYICNSNTSTPLIGGDFSTNELKIGGVQQFTIQYPPTGAGVANGSIFYGTDGGLYFKGGSGTVTLVAAP